MKTRNYLNYIANAALHALVVFCMVSISGVYADEVTGESGTIKSRDQIISELMPTRAFGVTPKAILDVKFEYDSARLTPEARLQLDELAHALQSNELSHLRYELVGHTDSSGSEDYNQTLSDTRAMSAFAYLVKTKGVEVGRLSAKGMGESRPLNPADTKSSVNRRVEIVENGDYQP